jgi:hypothetical protein
VSEHGVVEAGNADLPEPCPFFIGDPKQPQCKRCQFSFKAHYDVAAAQFERSKLELSRRMPEIRAIIGTHVVAAPRLDGL